MRKHQHFPEFTKSRAWQRFVREKSHEPYLGRRAHGLMPREPVPESIIRSAEKRKLKYMHSAAKRIYRDQP